MQAYGNDYVYIDAINQKLPSDLPELAKYVSNRHFGIGSDGMVLICDSSKADFRMRMFNPDGTEAEMCGNAIRSVGKYVYDYKLTTKTKLTVETLGGIKNLELTIGQNGFVSNIKANIGKPIFDPKLIPVNTDKTEFIMEDVQILDKTFKMSSLSWGNPHTVIFVDDVMNFDVLKYGPAIEFNTDVFPKKTNVTFAEIVKRDYIKIREWERGTGETIGCGTGCSTAVVIASILGLTDRTCTVEQIGGLLEIDYQDELYMKGPSNFVFESEIDVSQKDKGDYKEMKKDSKMLKDILENISYSLLKGNIETPINDIKYDSRKVTTGDVYVALVGYNNDGHDYIKDAIKNGANTIVISKMVDIKEDVNVLKVDDSRIALAYMSKAYFNNPNEEITMIGVTGTTGKTTTTHMIKDMLNNIGVKCGLIGSIGIKYNDVVIHTENTTPESYEIFKNLRVMADVGITHVTMECSSQAFKLNRLAGIIFDVGVLTNVTIDHIGPGEHENWEEYVTCKNKLFLNSKKIVVNNDSLHLDKVLKGVSVPAITYGIKNSADIKVDKVNLINDSNFFGSEFTTTGVINDTFKISIPGVFNVYNSLCALAVVKALNLDTSKAKEALLNVKVRGRMETALVTPKFKVLIDYAHTEDGMKELVKTLRAYNPKRLISVFGGGGNRPKERRYNLGEIIGGSSDLCIITEDNPRFEDISSINTDIKVGLDKVNAKYIEIEDRKDAILYAIENAEEGDLILLVGKGHEEYQDVKGVKHHFSEVEVIEDIKKKLNL